MYIVIKKLQQLTQMHVIANGYHFNLFQIVNESMVEHFFYTDHREKPSIKAGGVDSISSFFFAFLVLVRESWTKFSLYNNMILLHTTMPHTTHFHTYYTLYIIIIITSRAILLVKTKKSLIQV